VAYAPPRPYGPSATDGAGAHHSAADEDEGEEAPLVNGAGSLDSFFNRIENVRAPRPTCEKHAHGWAVSALCLSAVAALCGRLTMV